MSKGDEKLWALMNDKLDMLRSSGRLVEAIRVAETAVELAERAFPSGNSAQSLSLEKLGQLHDQAGDRQAARPYLLRAHQLLAQAEPRDPRALYRSARRLAFLSDNLGLLDEAVSFYERAIDAGRQLPELPYSDLGTMLNNIALIYRKSGRAQAAEPFYQHALTIYEKQLGPEHPDVASVLNNLAVFYTNEQRFPEAEAAHLRALAIRERTLPPEHQDIAQSKCNLAVVYHSRGDFARAAELYRASLAIWETVATELPGDYEVVASNYADLLRSLGKARQARQVEARVRSRRRA